MLFWGVQIQILKTDVYIYIYIYIYINTYPTPEAHTLLNWDALVGFPVICERNNYSRESG